MDADKYICKAKDIYEGLWRIGYYVYDFKTNTHYIMSNEIICGNAGSKPTRMDFSLSTYEINPDTLCRFTGMTDCAKRQYFEHDIIELPDEDSDCGMVFRYEITYDENDCMWYISDIFNAELYALGEFKTDEFFYAGNIFDNPELFEAGGKDGEEN